MKKRSLWPCASAEGFFYRKPRPAGPAPASRCWNIHRAAWTNKALTDVIVGRSLTNGVSLKGCWCWFTPHHHSCGSKKESRMFPYRILKHGIHPFIQQPHKFHTLLCKSLQSEVRFIHLHLFWGHFLPQCCWWHSESEWCPRSRSAVSNSQLATQEKVVFLSISTYVWPTL